MSNKFIRPKDIQLDRFNIPAAVKFIQQEKVYFLIYKLLKQFFYF